MSKPGVSDKKNNKIAPDEGNEFLNDPPPDINPVIENDEDEDENHANKILDRS